MAKERAQSHAQGEVFYETLARILKNNACIRDAYRIGLWANFYSVPVYAFIEQKYGLLRAEFVILVCLAGGVALGAKEICNVTGRPKNSISRAVGRLDKLGLILRAPHGSDGRREHLTITRKGQATYEEIIPLFAKRQNFMLQGLAPRDRKSLDRLLTKLTSNCHSWVAPQPKYSERPRH